MTTQAHPAAAAPATDPVTLYEQQRAALLAASTAGYADPHFTDAAADPDAEDATPPDTQKIDANEAAPDDGDGDAAPQAGGPPQFRIQPANELDTQAAWLLRRQPGLSFDEALKQARQHLGMAAASSPGVDPSATSAPAHEAEAPVHPDYLASAAEAARLFPQAAVPGGELNNRIAALDRMLKDAGDPLFTHVHKPLLLAQLAAHELRTPPQGNGPAAPLSPPAPSSTRQPPVRMTAPLAGGMPSTSTSQGLLDKQINDIRTPEQYRLLVSQLTGRKQ